MVRFVDENKKVIVEAPFEVSPISFQPNSIFRLNFSYELGSVTKDYYIVSAFGDKTLTVCVLREVP